MSKAGGAYVRYSKTHQNMFSSSSPSPTATPSIITTAGRHPWFKVQRGVSHIKYIKLHQDQASDGDAGDHISGDDLHILLFPVREAQRTLAFEKSHGPMVQSGDQVAISCECLEEDTHDPWYHVGISSDIQKNQTLQTMNPSLAST